MVDAGSCRRTEALIFGSCSHHSLLASAAAEQLTRRHHLFVHYFLQRLHHGRPDERRLTRDQFVKNGAEPVDVRRCAEHLRARGLLRGNIAWRADNRAAQGESRVVQAFGEAEVRDVRLAIPVEQDIPRLEVAVEDASLMGVMDGAGEGGEELGDCRLGIGYPTPISRDSRRGDRQ